MEPVLTPYNISVSCSTVIHVFASQQSIVLVLFFREKGLCDQTWALSERSLNLV